MHYDILVFSHLRWKSAKQRPQHIMERLSSTHRILFVEEPDDLPARSTFGTYSLEIINERLSVLTPHLPSDSWKVMCSGYLPLLSKLVTNIEDATFWFYSPLYVHLLDYFKPAFVVYDSMEELSLVRGASVNLPQYERHLLAQSDVVFTGGPSLYEAKKLLHDYVFCFPSAVDAVHFNKATMDDTIVPDDIAVLPKPIVGYHGTIDERIDFHLVEDVALAMTQVSFVMIGPVSKTQPVEIAKAENIFYLGKREYEVLPNYLKGIDVAMMPFHITDAARNIMSTKTLEYLAAGKPVVSTPVYDVKRQFSNVVSLAGDAVRFADEISKLLQEASAQRDKRLRMQRSVVQKTSWDNTVKEMKLIIDVRRSALAKFASRTEVV